MNKDKKQELAEMDERWNFEKTVTVPTSEEGLDWEKLRTFFNSLQDDHGDLYMEVSKKPTPGKLFRAKNWMGQKKETGTKVTFHHSQVYDWFMKLAYHLDVNVGEAVFQTLYNMDELRDKLSLGGTVTVEMNTMSEMGNPSESKVSKDELEEMIENE